MPLTQSQAKKLMVEQQAQGTQPHIPQEPTNGGSSKSNIKVHTTLPPSNDSMVSQPKVIVDEYLNNPVNVQMIDRLFNEFGDNILTTFLMKGIKTPSRFHLSKYVNIIPPTPLASQDPQNSQGNLGNSYIPKGPP